ncbi:MAG: phosphoribosyltransferase [Bacteroidales bacterium]|nr:phosphoribosyltransferase [Bacteroidales bacterium]
MITSLDGTSLHPAGLTGSTNLYGMSIPQLSNRYYLLSGPGSRQLLAFPEIVGFPCYTALVEETVAALHHLRNNGLGGDLDIFTILRGGLNYPLEEAAHRCGIRVRDMHFVSCERVIRNHIIQGLEIKYEKIRPSRGRVLAVGDILATGDTFRYCFEHLMQRFLLGGGSIRRILFFTIGGTRSFRLMEEIAEKLRALFADFEGIDCFFYEGAFSVYEDKGASGINVPDIDFGWKGGVVTPEFRRYIVDRPDALLEKCIIYDGGARRYELPVHFEEVLEYWEGIRDRAGRIDVRALVEEKLGYAGPVSYEDWLEITHLKGLSQLGPLWSDEQALLERPVDLRALAQRRIASIQNLKLQYEKD